MALTQAPHFLLFSQADPSGETNLHAAGRWSFRLQSLETEASFEASDYEPATGCERLELLSVVRGLEALEQPSRVTLITTSRRVRRGLRQGINHWRDNSWRWEYYGRFTPIKNGDLWQRIERASQIHEIDCHQWHSLAEEETEDLFLETPDAINHGNEAVSAPVPHALDKPGKNREGLAVAMAAPAEVEARIMTHNTVARQPRARLKKANTPTSGRVQQVAGKSMLVRLVCVAAAVPVYPFRLVHALACGLGSLVFTATKAAKPLTIRPRRSQCWTGSMDRARAG